MNISSYAGKPAHPSMLVNVPRLITAYYTDAPEPLFSEQRVAFGTSGHRGCPFDKTFNEHHILAVSQAICRYREQQLIDGPLFLGMDTHALSVPAYAGVLEVLAVNGVEGMIAQGDEFTPTPAVSHAGNGAPIGGLKVTTENGWFAARPSGTENIYKIYAESFQGMDHLGRILEEAQTIIDVALASTNKMQENLNCLASDWKS